MDLAELISKSRLAGVIVACALLTTTLAPGSAAQTSTIETLTLNAYAQDRISTVTSSTTLESGKTYRITVSGTFSSYEKSVYDGAYCTGPAPQTPEGPVSHDAFYTLYTPNPNDVCDVVYDEDCACYKKMPPYASSQFYMHDAEIVGAFPENTGCTGSNDSSCDPFYSPAPDHSYWFLAKGMGKPVQFELDDGSLMEPYHYMGDNYGSLTIEIGPGAGGPSPTPTPSGPMTARVASTELAFQERLEKLTAKLKPTYDQLTSDRDAYKSQLDQEKANLDAAAQDKEKARAELKSLAAELAQLRSEIGDEITNQQRSQMAEIQAAMTTQTEKWRDATIRVQTIEKTVLDYYEKVRINQEELAKLAEPLAAMDFKLEGVSVRAEGRELPVYRWRYEDGWSQILELNRAINRTRLELLENEKHNAFATFVELHDAATRQLMATADILAQNRQIKRYTRWAKDFVDLMKSYADGGPPKVFAEFMKKLGEVAWEYYKEAPNDTRVGDPNPGKEAVDAWAHRGIAEALASDAAGLAVDKGIADPMKDALVKDPISGVLCPALYQKFEDGASCQVGSEIKKRGAEQVEEFAKAVKKQWQFLNRRFNAIRKLGALKGLRTLIAPKRLGRVGVSAGTKAIDIAQDMAETFIGRWLDEREMNAWYEFVYKDLLARSAWGLYTATVNGFYNVEDRLKDLTAEKARLLAEWDEKTKQRIVEQAKFRVPEQVIIEVRFEPRFSDTPLPIEVYLGGLKAETGPVQPWGQKYYITKAQLGTLTQAQRDALVLELR